MVSPSPHYELIAKLMEIALEGACVFIIKNTYHSNIGKILNLLTNRLLLKSKAAPENHTSIVLTGDFNARSPVLWTK